MGAFERKSTAAVTGGATGLVVGVVGSFLHQLLDALAPVSHDCARWRPRKSPQTSRTVVRASVALLNLKKPTIIKFVEGQTGFSALLIWVFAILHFVAGASSVGQSSDFLWGGIFCALAFLHGLHPGTCTSTGTTSPHYFGAPLRPKPRAAQMRPPRRIRIPCDHRRLLDHRRSGRGVRRPRPSAPARAVPRPERRLKRPLRRRAAA